LNATARKPRPEAQAAAVWSVCASGAGFRKVLVRFRRESAKCAATNAQRRHKLKTEGNKQVRIALKARPSSEKHKTHLYSLCTPATTNISRRAVHNNIPLRHVMPAARLPGACNRLSCGQLRLKLLVCRSQSGNQSARVALEKGIEDAQTKTPLHAHVLGFGVGFDLRW
jgi:hypothetical protein